MTTDPGDLVFDPTCVRKGTGVLAPTPSLPAGGEGAIPPPSTGEARRGATPPTSTGEARRGAVIIPIEQITPGQYVYAHDGTVRRVRRVIRRLYRGMMVGLRHARSERMLWLTADHRVLAKLRPRSLGGQRDWSGIPLDHREYRRRLRRELTRAEQILWAKLRNNGVGFKFRRQHPIGPYIADFYCREAHLVVEVDGESHFTEEARAYDRERDEYMRCMGLSILRFTTQDIYKNLPGVLLAIENQCRLQVESVAGAMWVQAGNLLPGDIVFMGTELEAVPLEKVQTAFGEEEVYDLEVEGAHSFLTEVCAVHNCGSGTTAYCAEKWGRRWITCDTSRVALAIARQRLMTAKFDYYELREPERGPAGGFIYQTVPHITLESIAKNTEIDAIAEKYQAQIDQALAALNRALGKDWKEWEVPREVPHPLWPKEAQEAYWELRRLKDFLDPAARSRAEELLENIYRLTGHRWTLKDLSDPVPAPDWPEEAKEVLRRFWDLKRKKRREVDESIQRNAPQEELYDRPKVRRGIVRVSGPFTVEAIPVPAVEDPTQAPIPQFEEQEARERISDRGGDYLTHMLNLLKQQGGVLFPGGKKLELQNLRPLNLGYLHAEGEAKQNGKILRVAISFGPQHGPVTAFQVQESIPTAKMNGYPVLIFAGFSFDPEAQALIQKTPVAGIQVHFANIAPDVLVGDLLKTTRASQVFTVFGQPDVRVERQKDGTYVVELRGVDIYDPLTGEVHSTHGEDVAAWFLDTDYDGKTFKISQAFFPGDPDAWEKLQRALKAQIDPEAFEKM
ncbi:MAG: hypothetical protein C4297_15205, partial [Gemmataceae bacterium]